MNTYAGVGVEMSTTAAGPEPLNRAELCQLHIFYTMITSLLRCYKLVQVAQRKTNGSRTPSCIFLMLLLKKRERHVGVGLVILRDFD